VALAAVVAADDVMYSTQSAGDIMPLRLWICWFGRHWRTHSERIISAVHYV